MPLEFPAATLSAARGILETGRVLTAAGTGRWWVQPHGGRAFRVSVEVAERPSWIRCNCRAGAPVGGVSKCKHAVATLMAIERATARG